MGAGASIFIAARELIIQLPFQSLRLIESRIFPIKSAFLHAGRKTAR
jgi:hypothetical protein